VSKFKYYRSGKNQCSIEISDIKIKTQINSKMSAVLNWAFILAQSVLDKVQTETIKFTLTIPSKSTEHYDGNAVEERVT
jgi:hypothetical protein